jgi:hypothetical protein
MTDHEKVFTGIIEELQERAGASLRSVVAYGSALGPHFRPGISDYNILVVADPVDLPLLERLSALAGKWRKQRISAPIVVEPAFIRTALDSWPLEFLSMAASYRVLRGDDPLTGLVFQPEHVRLQCEREIRSKLLLFRRAYIESGGAPKHLKQTLDRGWPSLLAIFRGLLYLRGGPWQADGEPAWKANADQLGLPQGLLPELHAMRLARSIPAREVVTARFGQVLETLRRLVEEVDKW